MYPEPSLLITQAPLLIQYHTKFSPYDRIPTYRRLYDDGESGMSLSIALRGTDGIVLVTDDRTTYTGGGIEKRRDGSKKLWEIGNRFGLLSVNNNQGSASYLIEKLVDTFEHPEKYFKEPYVAQIKNECDIDVFADLCSTELNTICKPYSFSKEQLDLGNNLSFGFTVAGYTNVKTTKIVNLHSSQFFFSSVRKDYCIGGITVLGEYYMQKLWDKLFAYKDGICEPLCDVRLLKKLAVLILLETHRSHESVSDNINMRIITPEGIVSPSFAEIKQLKSECDRITNVPKLLRMLRKE